MKKNYYLLFLLLPLTLLTSCNKGNYSLTRMKTEGTSLEFETCYVMSTQYKYTRIELKVNIEGSIQISKENFKAIKNNNIYDCVGIVSDRSSSTEVLFGTIQDIYTTGPVEKSASLGAAFNPELDLSGAIIEYQKVELKINKSIGFN